MDVRSNEGAIGVISTGKYLPTKVVPNSEFEGRMLKAFDIYGNELFDVNHPEGSKCVSSWIEDTTGIFERRKAAPSDSAAKMGAFSIQDALGRTRLSANDLGGILGATVTSGRYPSAACGAQEALGIEGNRFGFPALDIGAACAGYPMALVVAASLMESGHATGPLAVFASEYLTRDVDYRDKISPLFGDGAGSAIVGRLGLTDGLEGRIVASIFGSCTGEGGEGMPKNCVDLIVRDSNGKLRMPYGGDVFKMAVSNMRDAVVNIIDKVGWSKKDIDLVIPHQANLRILKFVARQSGLPWEKVFTNISRYGNMSSATCAVGLDEAINGVPELGIEGVIKEGSKVILVSFGSGLVTSAVALDYAK